MVLISRLSGFRLCGLIAVSLVLGASIAAVLVALPWLGVMITPMIQRKATLGFLIGLEAVYVVALAALPAGTMFFSTMLWRARCIATEANAARGLLGRPFAERKATTGNAAAGGLLRRPFAERKATMRHTAARGLSVCVSSLVAIGLAELVVGLGRAGPTFPVHRPMPRQSLLIGLPILCASAA